MSPPHASAHLDATVSIMRSSVSKCNQRERGDRSFPPDKTVLQIMNPAQAVLTDVELTGVIADDHGVGEEAVRLDAAPQRPLGGDHHGIRIEGHEVGAAGVGSSLSAITAPP